MEKLLLSRLCTEDILIFDNKVRVGLVFNYSFNYLSLVSSSANFIISFIYTHILSIILEYRFERVLNLT